MKRPDFHGQSSLYYMLQEDKVVAKKLLTDETVDAFDIVKLSAGNTYNFQFEGAKLFLYSAFIDRAAASTDLCWSLEGIYDLDS